MTSPLTVEAPVVCPSPASGFDDHYDDQPLTLPPPAPLARQIETAVAERSDPWSRAKTIHGIVDEIYQVVAGAVGVSGDSRELGSLVALLHAASRHERQMSALMIGPRVPDDFPGTADRPRSARADPSTPDGTVLPATSACAARTDGDRGQR